ncbi:6-bladed beta-propeller [Mucilaginibacter sp. UYCu711]|uniref:6-bladed beta-propeller n=1 Tax=Mucilaginibacter sp. UYCu711 TaxID=3156339 RepID=UPI003D2393BE
MQFSLLSQKRKTPFLALAISALFFTQCKQPAKLTFGPDTFHVDESKVIEVKIDPAQAKSNEFTSSFLDSVHYVPLQTNDESLFSEISQLEVTADKYIIWDEASNSILFFNKNGDYITKISNKDKSIKQPFKKINHFAINEKKNEIVFDDRYTDQAYYYDLRGKFLRNVKKPVYIEPAYTIAGKYQIYYRAYNSEYLALTKMPACNIVITEDEKKFKYYLPFDTTAVDYQDTRGTNQWFFNNHHGIMNFSAPYDFNIYTIDTLTQLRKAFHIVLPDVSSLPEDFMTNARYNGKRGKYTDANRDVIYGVTDCYWFGDNLTFRLYGHSYNQMFLYNVKSQTLRSLSNYISDKKTYMLPVAKFTIHALGSNGELVSSISAADLFKYRLKLNGNKEWDNLLSAPLKKFFEGDNKQNPVLTVMTMKPKM